MIVGEIAKHFLRLASQYPVILLTGPRQAGKTTLCKHLFPSYNYVNLEDLEQRHYANSDPKGFLKQFSYGVILDEIQRTPDLPSYIQVIVDEQDRAGMFILTSSQDFAVIDNTNQSLAGRVAILKLLPLSMREIYQQDEQKSLAIDNIMYKGFYPRIHDKKLNPSEALSYYVTTYVERDIRSLMNIRNISSFEKFIKVCAVHTGQLINYSKLADDIGVNQGTIKEWLNLLKASYIVYELKPHYNNLKKRLVKSRKLYFYDVGLACYLLGITTVEHLMSHPLRGQLFENMIISEILKYRFNQAKDNNLYFFRDNSGNEVDLLLDYGQYLVAIEIKSSATFTKHHFKGLNFYQKLNAANIVAQALIYSGNKTMQYHNQLVVPYSDLESVFTMLPS